MKLDRIARFRENAWAFDCETHKIQPGLLAPPLVCASVARWNPATGRSEGRLLSRDEARIVFLRLLDSDCTIVGANIAFDMLVMAVDFARRGIDIVPKIFAAYEAGRVFDVLIGEALHAIAIGYLGRDPRTGGKLKDPITKKQGRYSLSIVLDLVLHRADAKVNDRFRQSYALLEDTPIADWPLDARVYPVDDACNTLDVALAQAGLIARPSDHEWPENYELPCPHCGVRLGYGGEGPCPPRCRQSFNVHNVSAQAYAAFAMHLGAAWGFAVDPVAVDALETRVRDSRAAAIGLFVKLGYLREEHDVKLALAALDAAGLPRKLFRKKNPDPSILDLLRKAGAVQKVVKNTGALKRAVALNYGARGACATCAGTGKVKSAKSGNPVGDRMCDSTGLNLDSAAVPRTDGSKCRTCSGKREYSTANKTNPSGPVVQCKQCIGQPDIVPGCGTGRDALYESGDDDVLIPFAEYLLEAKILETYLPFLRRGISEVDEDEDEDGEESDE